MKILAVIPARADSKGIPNKNLRLLGGRPMAYYAIQNALRSAYITDVVVSTDSAQVALLAEQLGARVHHRSKALCADDVTLDAVIYDAARGGAWDYIVTMQPTSPTLRVETLDAAIRYAIDAGLDTLLSAINAPHLAWKEENGRRVPDYAQRLNRQYLPPHYQETGAFVISRAGVVTPQTRIGEKVDVYELPEAQALDIDSFTDMYAAAAILQQKKVAIYVNGNNTRGMGHIYRALELADEFYVKPDIYYDSNQTDVRVFGRTMHTLIAVDGEEELFARCRAERYTLFINDILSTTLDYMQRLRAALPEAKIVNFEDDGEGIREADIVFNALYRHSDMEHVYAGEKYYIPAKIFLFYDPITIREKVQKVFISFGGADPQNYSDRLLEIVSQPKYASYDFLVVLGRAKHNVEALMRYNRFPNIEVLFDVDNMPKLMTSCDIGVTSRGRTSYELAMLGIPTITMSQNAYEQKHGFVCEENGFTYLGVDPGREMIEASLEMYLSLSRTVRQHYQDKLLSHDLRNGRRRVMALIDNL